MQPRLFVCFQSVPDDFQPRRSGEFGTEDEKRGGPGAGGGAVPGDHADRGEWADDRLAGGGINDVAGNPSGNGLELAVVPTGGEGALVQLHHAGGFTDGGIGFLNGDLPFVIADDDFPGKSEGEIGDAELPEALADPIGAVTLKSPLRPSLTQVQTKSARSRTSTG